MTTDETAILDTEVAALPIDDGVAEPLEVSAVEPRIYEIGYHIIPTVKEDDVEKTVGEIRSAIESAGGGPSSGGKATFIAEGAPSLIKLAYPMSVREGEKYTEYDRGYFGWIKFEAPASMVAVLNNALKSNLSVLRFVIWKTVREDTRAKIKPPTMREVKRTDIIKPAPRRAVAEESAAPVSEEDLEKALQDITTE
ncbi:MAG: 30S ribosomal protein S6 [bacterium]|nr:30S ribosomal protein S6 [bacterium]